MTSLTSANALPSRLADNRPAATGGATLSINQIMYLIASAKMTQQMLDRQIALTYQVAQITQAVQALNTQLEAAQKTYQVTQTQAILGIIGGIVGGIASGAALGTSLPAIGELGHAAGKTLDGIGGLATSAITLASQQDTAQAEYTAKLAEQSQRRSEAAFSDIRQTLQDILQCWQAMVTQLNQLTTALGR